MYAIICETERVPMREIFLQGFQTIDDAVVALLVLGHDACQDPRVDSDPTLHNFDTMLSYHCQNDLWKFKIVEEEMVGA